jgi:hypothetical protein
VGTRKSKISLEDFPLIRTPLKNFLQKGVNSKPLSISEILFKKYGSTSSLWAKPDNSNDLMKKVEVWPGMNDGQFILSKELAHKDILRHMKFYVNHILSYNKEKLTRKEYLDLCWVSTQYAVWDYFQNNKNPVKHFDEDQVMLSIEPEHKNIENLVLHHYYSGNTDKFVPKEYL